MNYEVWTKTKSKSTQNKSLGRVGGSNPMIFPVSLIADWSPADLGRQRDENFVIFPSKTQSQLIPKNKTIG